MVRDAARDVISPDTISRAMIRDRERDAARDMALDHDAGPALGWNGDGRKRRMTGWDRGTERDRNNFPDENGRAMRETGQSR